MGNFVAYSTAKGALIALSKSVAMHCATKAHKFVQFDSPGCGGNRHDPHRDRAGAGSDGGSRAIRKHGAPAAHARVEKWRRSSPSWRATRPRCFRLGIRHRRCKHCRDDGRMTKRLEGRVAVVSGALRGIGLAMRSATSRKVRPVVLPIWRRPRTPTSWQRSRLGAARAM